MEKNYWHGRWERNETGWHQTEVEPALVSFFQSKTRGRILVPLCGKTLDMVWLAEQGFEVIGVELSELGCKTFFEENKISYTQSLQGPYQVLKSQDSKKKITLFQGDFFELNSAILGKIDAIYDRAALIALPPDIRARYVQHMIKLIDQCSAKNNLNFLQLVFYRTPHDEKGPPFSVRPSDLVSLYGNRFHLTEISNEPVEMGAVSPDVPADLVYKEAVYSLTLK